MLKVVVKTEVDVDDYADKEDYNKNGEDKNLHSNDELRVKTERLDMDTKWIKTEKMDSKSSETEKLDINLCINTERLDIKCIKTKGLNIKLCIKTEMPLATTPPTKRPRMKKRMKNEANEETLDFVTVATMGGLKVIRTPEDATGGYSLDNPHTHGRKCKMVCTKTLCDICMRYVYVCRMDVHEASKLHKKKLEAKLNSLAALKEKENAK